MYTYRAGGLGRARELMIGEESIELGLFDDKIIALCGRRACPRSHIERTIPVAIAQNQGYVPHDFT